MNSVDALGLFAGFCTMSAVIPQIFKAWKTKKVKGVSPIMFGTLLVGVGLWVVYGILKNDLAIIITNAISLTLNMVMLFLMLRLKRN